MVEFTHFPQVDLHELDFADRIDDPVFPYGVFVPVQRSLGPVFRIDATVVGEERYVASGQDVRVVQFDIFRHVIDVGQRAYFDGRNQFGSGKMGGRYRENADVRIVRHLQHPSSGRQIDGQFEQVRKYIGFVAFGEAVTVRADVGQIPRFDITLRETSPAPLSVIARIIGDVERIGFAVDAERGPAVTVGSGGQDVETVAVPLLRQFDTFALAFENVGQTRFPDLEIDTVGGQGAGQQFGGIGVVGVVEVTVAVVDRRIIAVRRNPDVGVRNRDGNALGGIHGDGSGL